MASFCLPKEYRDLFLDALKSGKLDPVSLAKLTSEQRRDAFSSVLKAGDTTPEAASATDALAHEVNALFEEKLLKKSQKTAMIEWAKSLTGLRPEVRTDISAKIQQLDKVLSPADERSFLEDLAAKRLNISVTHEEARQIYNMSSETERLKNISEADPESLDKRTTYGRSLLNLRDLIEDMKPGGESWTDKALEVISIPKSFQTSILHFSAPFVQGYGLISTKEWWLGWSQMMKYFADDNNYQNLRAYIITHPDYQLALDGQLGLTDLSDKLSNREDSLQSTYLQKANEYLADKSGLPINIVGASSRAFTGYLNYIRFNRFVTLLNAARMSGEDVRIGSSVVHDLAKTVNDFTGRGELGDSDRLRNITKVANAIFFAPRKIIATVEMFNPWTYLKPDLSPTARTARIRQMLGTLTATATILGLSRVMGAKVDLNPISQGFAKVNVGGEQFDFTGGNATYVRLLARLTTGKSLSSSGKLTTVGVGYKPTSRADMIEQYLRGKLAPVSSIIDDVANNMTNAVGEPVTLKGEIYNHFTPIVAENLLNFYYNNPNDTAAILPALTSFFGVGLESPLPKTSKFGMTPWGEQESAPFGH